LVVDVAVAVHFVATDAKDCVRVHVVVVVVVVEVEVIADATVATALHTALSILDALSYDGGSDGAVDAAAETAVRADALSGDCSADMARTACDAAAAGTAETECTCALCPRTCIGPRWRAYCPWWA